MAGQQAPGTLPSPSLVLRVDLSPEQAFYGSFYVGIEGRSSCLYKKQFPDCFTFPAPYVNSLNSSYMLFFGFLENGYSHPQISSIFNVSVAFGSFSSFHILKSLLSSQLPVLLQLL